MTTLNQPGRGNTALKVIGSSKLNRRLTDLERRFARQGDFLAHALRIIAAEVLRRTPVRTGKLYRSFRVHPLGSSYVILEFSAPYAFWPEVRSKRNRGFARRGAIAGIKKANSVQDVVRFRLRDVRRGGAKTAILQVIISVTPI